MSDVALKCICGEVTGRAGNVTPSNNQRLVCCCSDCQAFAKHLGREKETLDEFGGSDLVQMSQSQVVIEQGHNNLQCLRLKKKGLLRWHTSCCNTPVGNTVNAKMPFIALSSPFMDEPNRDAVLGPVKAYVQTQDAIGEPNYPKKSAKFPIGTIAKMMSRMLVWKIKGLNKPTAFFGEDGRPIVKPRIVG